jgi:Mn-dependent DtxR family transcriptional regulator
MSRSSSTFLRGANSGDGDRSLDEPSVLAALNSSGKADLLQLSGMLQANPKVVEEVLWGLLSRDFVRRVDGGVYELTETGQRALRYSSSAR